MTNTREKTMERRSFIKSLLPLATLFSFRSAFGSQAGSEFYKGKRLVVVPPRLQEARGDEVSSGLRPIPRFNSDQSIIEEMRRFVELCDQHEVPIGYEVWGCVHSDGCYSVCSYDKDRQENRWQYGPIQSVRSAS
jgi:hypothetical protein